MQVCKLENEIASIGRKRIKVSRSRIVGWLCSASLLALLSLATKSACAQVALPAAGIINTLAGNGTWGFSGDGGAATIAQFTYLTGVAVDASGNLYIVDNQRIRKMTASTGIITTVVGGGSGCPEQTDTVGDGCSATNAGLYSPRGVAVDASGNIYIADYNGIREVIASTGIITTVAGTGIGGYSGDGGAATNAELYSPGGVAVDASGNIFIPDTSNQRIRKVTASTGLITTVAGTGIGGYSGDGGAATSAELNSPSSVAVDASGNIYFTDLYNQRIRKVTASTGIITTVAGDGTGGYSGDGGAATSAKLYYPSGVAVDVSGNIYIADTNNQRIRKVTASTGIIITVAGIGIGGYSGDGGAATSAELNSPSGIAVDSSRNLYIADYCRVRAVGTSTPTISSLSPASVPVGTSVKMTITGQSFGATQGSSMVTFNGMAATSITSWSATSIIAAVPTGAATGPGNVVVVTVGGLASNRVAFTSQAAPTISWAAPAAITYGTPLSAAQLNASLSVAGSCVYRPPAGTILGAGKQILSAICTPTDTTSYSTPPPRTVTLTVNPSAAAPTHSAPAYIQGIVGATFSNNVVAGHALYAVAFDSRIDQSFTFTDSQGNSWNTVALAYLNGDEDSLAVGCTVANSSGADTVGAVTVPASDNSSGVANANGSMLLYEMTGSSCTLDVPPVSSNTMATSCISGPLPSSTPNDFLLGACMAMQGPNPLAAGSGWSNAESVSVFFAETQIASTPNVYQATSSSFPQNEQSTILVAFQPNSNAAQTAPTITWAAPAAITYGTPLSTAQLNASLSVAGSCVYTPAMGAVLSAGTHTLSVTCIPVDTTDYSEVGSTVMLTVNKAMPTITWATPAAIPYGTPLSAAQLNASLSVAGWCDYTPAMGAVLAGGPQTLLASCSPVDTIDYSTPPTASVVLTVTGGAFDSGTVSLIVNGTTAAKTTYGIGSTPETVAAGLSAGVTPDSPVNIAESGGSLYLQSKIAGKQTNYEYFLQNTGWDRTDYPIGPSFPLSIIHGYLEGGADPSTSGTPTTLYSFQIPSYSSSATPSGYDAVGNIVGYSDSVNGTWGPINGTAGFTYDQVNRLTSASGSVPNYNASGVLLNYTSVQYCWGYDSFGNRTINYSGPCSNNPAQTDYYYSNNQVKNGLVSYDASGDVTYNVGNGNANAYLYDAEGRVCAVQSQNVDGVFVKTGYVYNAEGVRVAKGSIKTMSCDPSTNGFQPITDYIVGPKGEQLTETASDGKGNMLFQRTYIYAGSQMIGSYELAPGNGTTADTTSMHFRLTDWLGSLRVTTDYAGVVESTCTSLPFGDGQSCTGPADPHHFTGKERDTESGNDYFGARYYSSAMGRFLSPDWSAKAEPVPYAKLDNPQTLNLYAYVGNNPLSRVDKDGHVDALAQCKGKYPCSFSVSDTVTHYSKDPKTGKRVADYTVKITTSFNLTADSKGNVTVATSASVQQLSGRVSLSEAQLGVMSSNAAFVQAMAVGRGYGPNTTQLMTATGIAETSFGASRPGEKAPWKDPSINPLQLSNGNGNMDLGHNVDGALNEFTRAGRSSHYDAMSTYKHFSDGGADTMGNFTLDWNSVKEEVH